MKRKLLIRLSLPHPLVRTYQKIIIYLQNGCLTFAKIKANIKKNNKIKNQKSGGYNNLFFEFFYFYFSYKFWTSQDKHVMCIQDFFKTKHSPNRINKHTNFTIIYMSSCDSCLWTRSMFE